MMPTPVSYTHLNAAAYSYPNTEIIITAKRCGNSVQINFENHGRTIEPEQISGDVYKRQEQESLEKAKQYAAQKRELKKRQKDVEAKKRTHRLCQIGCAVAVSYTHLSQYFLC